VIEDTSHIFTAYDLKTLKIKAFSSGLILGNRWFEDVQTQMLELLNLQKFVKYKKLVITLNRP